MRKNGIVKKIVTFSSIGLITALSSQVQASGYKLEFQSPAVIADSGEAAVVEDAGTNWYNAAGLVYLPQQIVGAGTYFYGASSFSGTATAPDSTGSGGPTFTQTGSASSHPNVLLPALHYNLPFKERYAFGISVVPAWGLLENYKDGSMVRYNLVSIYTKTIDISPSFAMLINPQWSFGLGPDLHYFELQSKSHSNTTFVTGGNDTITRYTANDWAWGGHIGVLFRLDNCTRFGINYRTKIMNNLKGYSDFSAPPPIGVFETNNFSLPFPMPPTTTLSAYHDMTPVWAMMGTIAYDQWSIIRNFHGQNIAAPPPTGPIQSLVLTQRLSNTFDYGIGTHYKLNERWMMRANMKYLPTPTNNTYRTLAFPDGAKLGFQIGARYQMNKKIALDGVYGHVFVRHAGINDVNPLTNALANGTVHTGIDLVGAQIVWDI